MTTARRAGATSAATLLGLALTIGVADLAAPEWTEAAGMDLWDMPTFKQEIENNKDKSRLITDEIEESKRRQALKEHLIDGLLAKHLTLRQVTNEFLALNERQLPCKLMIRSSFMGATDEEKTARNVLSFAIHREHGFVRRIQTVARLTQELKELGFCSPEAAK